MKPIIKLLTALFFLTIYLSSCDDFIDRPPVSNIVKEKFYKTPAQFELATIGLYDSQQTVYRHRYIDLAELPSDNANCQGNVSTTIGQFDKFAVSPTNPTLREMWINLYNSIQQVNILLESVPHIEFVSDEWRDQRVGEARFIRALNYFNLVRLWGDVPLLMETVTQDSLFRVTRTPQESVYEAIISDLTFASQHLPVEYASSEIGRVTKGAALALLGKVYLTSHRYAEAIFALNSVIDLGVYKLLPNYGDIFRPENANHEESIFEIQYKGGRFGEGSRWGTSAHPQSLSEYFGISTNSNLIPDADFRNFMDQSSVRYNESVGRVVVGSSAVFHIKKHYMEHTVQNQSEDNWPLIRYADVLLMHAEATNELFGPRPASVEMINQIRRRAYGLDINGTNKSRDILPSEYSSREVFRKTIQNERRAELAFEGHRWFDLVRTDTFVEVMNIHFKGNYTVEEYHRYFPIPQRERDINPRLSQNPGYATEVEYDPGEGGSEN